MYYITLFGIFLRYIGCPKSRDAFLKDYSTKSIVSVVKIFDGKVEKES